MSHLQCICSRWKLQRSSATGNVSVDSVTQQNDGTRNPSQGGGEGRWGKMIPIPVIPSPQRQCSCVQLAVTAKCFHPLIIGQPLTTVYKLIYVLGYKTANTIFYEQWNHDIFLKTAINLYYNVAMNLTLLNNFFFSLKVVFQTDSQSFTHQITTVIIL